jgi:protein-disulfide isomerase
MRYLASLLSVAVLLAAVPSFAEDAAPAKSFSDADKAAIEDIIKNYLTKDHPEVVMQAVQELQKREQASAEAKSQDAIKTSHDKIYTDADLPYGGNPKGDVTVVEFFDYQCGYCKMSEPSVEKLLGDDKNVRMIYKEFPILGPASTEAAKAAFAAAKQSKDKYLKFHSALMNKKEHLNDDIIYAAAKDTGLDVEKLKKDMASDAVNAQVKAALDLGNAVGVRGTPMFIINDKVFPGALQYEQMKQAVDDARSATNNP